MTHRPALHASAVLLATFAVACGHCGTSRVAPETLLPPEGFAVVVPEIGATAGHLRALYDTIRAGEGGPEVVAFVARAQSELGFDPLDPASLKEAGFDPKGGLGVGGPPQAPVVLLPVADKEKAEATLKRLATKGGLAVAGSQVVDGKTVSTLGPTAESARAAYAFHGGYLVVSGGPKGVAAVAATMGRTKEQSAATWKAYEDVVAKTDKADVRVLVTKAVAAGADVSVDRVVAGVSVSANELAVRAYVDGLQKTGLEPVLRSTATGTKAFAKLDASQPVYFRAGTPWTEVMASLLKADVDAPRALGKLAKETGVDLVKLAGSLEPGLALEVGVSRSTNLGAVTDPGDPGALRSLQTLAVATVADEKALVEGLTKFASLEPIDGVALREEQDDGGRRWSLLDGDDVVVAMSLRGGALYVSGNPETLTSLVAAERKVVSKADFGPRAGEALFGDASGALVLDFEALAKAVSSLPSSAYGGGPGGLVAKSLVRGILDPAARLQVVLATKPEGEALRVEASIGVR